MSADPVPGAALVPAGGQVALHGRSVLTRGAERPFIDALARMMSLGNRLLFLNIRFEDHRADPDTLAAIEAFVAHHEIDGVHVRVGEYDPIGDLGRLFANSRVSIVWRLLFGLPTWLAVTLSCGRLFGGDHYNPWSDTVHLFSSHKAIALHELGHVLDFRRRSMPGLYALTRYIPGAALYQEYEASRHAIEFMRDRGEIDDEMRAWRLLFPAYSTYVFGALVELFPSAGIGALLFPVIALGHVLGIGAAIKREGEVGEGGPTVRGQVGEDFSEAVHELSPTHPRGRDLWGVFLGTTVGSSLCGVGALFGAWAGFALVRRGLQDNDRVAR